MNIWGYLVGLCFGVIFLARATAAINSIELHKLVSKLESFEDKMQGVEQNVIATMESSLKKMEQRLQENMLMHFETRMQALEDSWKKSMEALKNHVIPKMDHIQETSETELKKIGENKNTLNMLIDTVQNISMQAKLTTRFFNFMYPASSCRQAPSVSDTYMIKIGRNSKQFEVFCEQNKFEGGWTVIQHRYDGSVDFYRNWTEYRNGFGALDAEFWLGLEYVHQITKNQPHELLVEFKDFHGNYAYAKYDGFEIGSESEKYVLKKLGTYSGTAEDSMGFNKKEQFSTFDRDNDKYTGNCAEERHGAWWYKFCTWSNLNGRYQNTTDDGSAMHWYFFKNDKRGLSYSRMMIRDIIN